MTYNKQIRTSIMPRLEGGLLVSDLVPSKSSGDVAKPGDRVAIHYTGRLASKQGWVFDSSYSHFEGGRGADYSVPSPFVFTVGDPGVLAGLSQGVVGMRRGGVRRLVIPPALGYLSEADSPTPPEFWQRRRLFSTIFNPTRMANGEGDTLATLVFDVELLQALPVATGLCTPFVACLHMSTTTKSELSRRTQIYSPLAKVDDNVPTGTTATVAATGAESLI